MEKLIFRCRRLLTQDGVNEIRHPFIGISGATNSYQFYCFNSYFWVTDYQTMAGVNYNKVIIIINIIIEPVIQFKIPH